MRRIASLKRAVFTGFEKGVSPNLTWHALVHLYKGYLCKALPSVAEGPAYALRGGPVFNNQL